MVLHETHDHLSHLDGRLLVFGEPGAGAGRVVVRLVVDDFGSFRVGFVEFQQSVLVRLRLGQALGQLGFFAREFPRNGAADEGKLRRRRVVSRRKIAEEFSFQLFRFFGSLDRLGFCLGYF